MERKDGESQAKGQKELGEIKEREKLDRKGKEKTGNDEKGKGRK